MSVAKKDKLDSAIFRLEVWTLFCAILVVGGLIGENATASSWVVKDSVIDAATGKPIPGRYNLVTEPSLTNKLFGFLVIVGVIGETAFGVILLFANRRRISLDKLEIGELERGAEQLRLEISEANLATEELREENLKLRNRMSYRTLSRAQRSSLEEQARKLGAVRLDVFTVGSDLEVIVFTDMIVQRLEIAGWNIKRWVCMAGMNIDGIWIGAGKGSGDKAERLADQFVEIFESIDVDVSYTSSFDNGKPDAVLHGPTWDDADIANIRLIIGEKRNDLIGAQS